MRKKSEIDRSRRIAGVNAPAGKTRRARVAGAGAPMFSVVAKSVASAQSTASNRNTARQPNGSAMIAPAGDADRQRQAEAGEHDTLRTAALTFRDHVIDDGKRQGACERGPNRREHAHCEQRRERRRDERQQVRGAATIARPAIRPRLRCAPRECGRARNGREDGEHERVHRRQLAGDRHGHAARPAAICGRIPATTSSPSPRANVAPVSAGKCEHPVIGGSCA